MSTFKKNKSFLLIIFLTLVSTFLHFYNLNWGAPFYFHPDERNIASAVSQLHFPDQMNPHFSAYGSFPIYIIYFTTVLTNYISNWLQLNTQTQPLTVTFDQAILIGRVYSALFATLLIPLLYVIARNLTTKQSRNENKNKNAAGLFAAFLATASVGFIQFAHFGTFEMWLTFFGVILFWISLNYLAKQTHFLLILSAVIFGVLVSTKVTSLALLPIPLAIIFAKQLPYFKNESGIRNQESGKTKLLIHNSLFLILLRILKDIMLFSIISLLIYCMTNPFVFLDTKDFISSMNYESSVALGTLPVFYTQTFLMTIPIVYQFLHVYPFLLNPLLTILFIPAFIYILFVMVKQKNASFLLLISYFLLLFLSQAFLFVKWTRYMIPTLPFIYIIIAIFFSNVIARSLTTKQSLFRLPHSLRPLAMTCILVICTIFAFSYFKTAFINTDTRIDALTFAQHTILLDATILSEPSDLGIVPFQDAFPHLDTFNFYDLDSNSLDATEPNLQQKLAMADYIVLPSQRILQSRMENTTQFPKGYLFYKSLLSGQLGFKKIYQTPCDIFCKITYLGDPVYWWEQTATVFDRPTVFIFKKNS